MPINIFIAYASGVKREEKLVRKAIAGLGSTVGPLFGEMVQPRMWEIGGPDVANYGQSGRGATIIGRLAECDWMVAILDLRPGNYNAADLIKLQQELLSALKNRQRVKKLLVYFKGDPSQIPAELVTGFQQLTEELHERVLPVQYFSVKEFRGRIHWDLLEHILHHLSDRSRGDVLRKFFIFEHGENADPPVLIAHPAPYQHSNKFPNIYDWTVRLMPSVTFEDTKATQKLERALRAMGVRAFKSVMIPHPSLDNPGNRIWLCIPRNPYALYSLEAFRKQGRVHFSFSLDADPVQRTLTWNMPGKSPIVIYSPLSKYLRLQREEGIIEWDPVKYGHTIARDYAVISRFKISDTGRLDDGFFHYFIGGIRGLGTWGAAWFIQHCYETLATMGAGNDEDVQRLLEVTFCDNRISNVQDVTEWDADDFAQRGEDAFIEKEVDSWLSEWRAKQRGKAPLSQDEQEQGWLMTYLKGLKEWKIDPIQVVPVEEPPPPPIRPKRRIKVASVQESAPPLPRPKRKANPA